MIEHLDLGAFDYKPMPNGTVVGGTLAYYECEFAGNRDSRVRPVKRLLDLAAAPWQVADAFPLPAALQHVAGVWAERLVSLILRDVGDGKFHLWLVAESLKADPAPVPPPAPPPAPGPTPGSTPDVSMLAAQVTRLAGESGAPETPWQREIRAAAGDLRARLAAVEAAFGAVPDFRTPAWEDDGLPPALVANLGNQWQRDMAFTVVTVLEYLTNLPAFPPADGGTIIRT